MGSKMLTGSMLLGGVLLAIVMVFLEPSTGSDQDKFAVQVQAMLDNATQTFLVGVGFTLAILGILIGTSYLARSMQGEQKSGSDLAGLASVLALLAAAVMVVSSGLQMGLLHDSYADKGGDVATAYAISEGIFPIAFMLMAGSLLLLGIAIVRQKNLNQIVGGLTALVEAIFLLGMLMPSGDPDLDSTSTMEAIGGILWVSGFFGWLIMTMVLGVVTIRSARQNAS